MLVYIINFIVYIVNQFSFCCPAINLFVDSIIFFHYTSNEVIDLTIVQKIKMALAYKGMTQAELARQLNISPQLLNKRLKTGKFTTEELEAIAQAMGAQYTFGFVFEDGTEI